MVWLLSFGTQVAWLEHPGLWGLARSARVEEASLPLQCFDSTATSALAHTPTPAEPETVLRPESSLVSRLAHLSRTFEAGSYSCRESHLVTGGTAGIGLLTARWLAQSEVRALVLASRSGVLARDMTGEWRQMCATSVATVVQRCDTVEAAHTSRLVALTEGRLAGVWHAAGVIVDGLLQKQTAQGLASVYAPKAHGVLALHNECVPAPLRACTLFSSVVVLLGGAGQANYSAANACLDALASLRRVHSLPAVSVQWSAWAEVGMAARGAAAERMSAEAASGFGRIGLVDGLGALHAAVCPRMLSSVGVVPVQWQRVLGSSAVPAFLSGMAVMRPLSTSVRSTSAAACGVSLDAVLEMVKRTAGGSVDADAPLMEAGIDSLGAVELRNQLHNVAGERRLPSTLVFDHPTARQLSAILQPTLCTGSGGRKLPSQPTQLMHKQGSLTLENDQSDQLNRLLSHVPQLLAQTAQVPGNQEVDLHPCTSLPSIENVRALNSVVCIVSGASRGIGQGIAVRFGKAGRIVSVLGRSEGTVSWGPGTLSEVVKQINAVGGEGLAVACDVSKPAHISEAVKRIVEKFGRIDVLVNNAAAHYTMGVESLDEKRFDLMNSLNVRGTFLLTREVMPHMSASILPHVLTIAPAPIADRTWIGPTTCYSASKLAQGMLTAAWSVEFPSICFNALWPQLTVATFAITNTFHLDMRTAVTVAHVADPAYRIVTSESRMHFFRDSDVLNSMGVTDISAWKVDPSSDELENDFMIEPVGLQLGQRIQYAHLHASGMSLLPGDCVFLVGINDVTATMYDQVTAVGALATTENLTADVKAIDAMFEHIEELDALFISAAPKSALGTLETTGETWQKLFELQCKAPNFFVAKALPDLRRTKQPRVAIVAQAPVCHSESFLSPAVPSAVLSQLRGMYVIGMAEEFGPAIKVNGIWDRAGCNPPASACLELLTCEDAETGKFYAVDVDALPWSQVVVGFDNYSMSVSLADCTTNRWLKRFMREASLEVFVDRSELAIPALRMERADAQDLLHAIGMTPEQVGQFMKLIWMGPVATGPSPLAHLANSAVAGQATVIRVSAVCEHLPGGVMTAKAHTMMATLGVDVTSEASTARWDADEIAADAIASGLSSIVQDRIRHGAFLHGSQLFDAISFTISSAEASAMDPQQQLLLESGYGALHMGCLPRLSLLGSNVGIYLGYSTSDFAQVLATSPLGKSVYSATGSSGSIASGRLSYVLGLNGACSTIDTACSSSLVATSFARAAFVLSENHIATVMAVNLILDPGGTHTQLAIAGMTSRTGKCHTFDTRADGYARSELCSAAMLQTASTQMVAPVLLEGSAVCCDGRSASLTAPNGQAQRQVISLALRVAEATPATLSLMEAHGTGTELGDPIEMGSATAVVLQHRDKSVGPLALGSVKANTGHAEAGAGSSAADVWGGTGQRGTECAVACAQPACKQHA
jgi:NAD(P)-dependent dehydrogenase (short-subunit alcohol dehydrogenase family)/3-oxoacyl-(acyl-carrier-protein) synthase